MSDDELIESLKQARDNVVNIIRDITLSPKPTYEIDGQKIQWTEYLAQMTKTLSAINEQITGLDEPYEFESIYYP